MNDNWKRLDRHGLSSEPVQPALMAQTVDKLDEYADRIEELEADLSHAKISEVFWRDGWRTLDQDNRAVEAKLAKAVEALKFYACDCGELCEQLNGTCGDYASTTLAELK